MPVLNFEQDVRTGLSLFQYTDGTIEQAAECPTIQIFTDYDTKTDSGIDKYTIFYKRLTTRYVQR